MENTVKTRLKILPTILRLLIGITSLAILTLALFFSKEFISKPSSFSIVSALTCFLIGYLFLINGLFSIKTFSIDKQSLKIKILGGIFWNHIGLSEIESYIRKKNYIIFGPFDELILNKKNGKTIFIQSFDQNNFEELSKAVEELVVYDNNLKANYWTNSNQIGIIGLLILIITIVLVYLIGK